VICPVSVSSDMLPLKIVEEVLRLYRYVYHDFNVKQFCEKLSKEHGINVSFCSLHQSGVKRLRSPIDLVAFY